jgi:hypothetical protein
MIPSVIRKLTSRSPGKPYIHPAEQAEYHIPGSDQVQR